MRVKLKGYEGPVSKTATVVCNDPHNRRAVLTMKGTVRPLIAVRPNRYVQFQGAAERLAPATVELVANPQPFHVQKTEDTLQGKASYKLETLQEGKHHRLTIINESKGGNYAGFIRVLTDHPEKAGADRLGQRANRGNHCRQTDGGDGGEASSQQPVQPGKVVIVNNRGESFQITGLSYDERLLQVTQQHLYGQAGFVLEIKPRMENISAGTRTETVIQVETDVPGEKKEIKVHIVHL